MALRLPQLALPRVQGGDARDQQPTGLPRGRQKVPPRRTEAAGPCSKTSKMHVKGKPELQEALGSRQKEEPWRKGPKM